MLKKNDRSSVLLTPLCSHSVCVCLFMYITELIILFSLVFLTKLILRAGTSYSNVVLDTN